jgi:hypothetical protein
LVLARLDESVLQYTAKPKVATFNEDEELRGTRMNVRRVDTARLEEANGDADAEISRERVAFSGLSPADRCQCCKGGCMSDTVLTAALTAPLIAPLAGSGPLKSKTISFSSASPDRSAPPSTSSRRKRSIAVGAEERSRKSSASASAVAAGREAELEVQLEL